MVKKGKNKNSTFLFFTIFIVLACCVAVLLEYLDFKKGRESILFRVNVEDEAFARQQDLFNRQLIEILKKESIRYDYTVKDEALRYKIEVSSEAYDSFISAVRELCLHTNSRFQLAEVQDTANSTIRLFKVEIVDKVSHWLLVTRLNKPVAKKKEIRAGSTPGPRISFIIDDIGNKPQISKVLKRLNIPISGSILPHTPFALEEAEGFKSYHLETLIHIPMQPKNSKRHFPHDRYITINSSDAEIRSLIRRAKAIAPHAKGCNNHEGSLITSNEKVMRRVLRILKEEGLFFVDSRTATTTIAYDLARAIDVKTIYRDVFLDTPQTYENSMAEIKRLVSIALRKGKAVAIGHPFESTLQAIHDSIPYIRSRGVRIVFASQLLE